MHSFEELLNKDIKNLIRLSSMKLARACNDPSSERKDMEQELYMELFKRFKEFNEEKSSFKTFVRHVINGHSSTLIRRNYAQKRGRKISQSSIYEEEYCEDVDESIALIDKIDGQDALHAMGGNSSSLPERIKRMKDVNLLLASLPDDLQEACDFIMNGKSISETVKSMGVSRATFYYQRIIPLKKIFREQFLT